MYEKRDYKVEINKHKYPKGASIYDVRTRAEEEVDHEKTVKVREGGGCV